MLVLSRKVEEKIRIAGNIVITVLQIRGNKARLGIEAPDDVKVLREELLGPRKDLPAKIPEERTDVQKTFTG